MKVGFRADFVSRCKFRFKCQLFRIGSIIVVTATFVAMAYPGINHGLRQNLIVYSQKPVWCRTFWSRTHDATWESGSRKSADCRIGCVECLLSIPGVAIATRQPEAIKRLCQSPHIERCLRINPRRFAMLAARNRRECAIA